MGSFHVPTNLPASALPETSCAYLLQEMKLIWDEVGHDEIDREKVFLELEQECLEVYKRKVDSANILRARLHRTLAESEAELTNLLLSLGERSFSARPEKLTGSLKEQLEVVTPILGEMKTRKEERVNKFQEVLTQIQKISSEIAGNLEYDSIVVNENDLSLKKLEEYQNELDRLHTEKSERLMRVEEYINEVHDLAAIMGMDSSKITSDVHPSLSGSNGEQTKNISDGISDRLKRAVDLLKDEKKKRTEKLCKLGKALKNLWDLMDTNPADQQPFTHMAMNTISAGDISRPGSLTIDFIHQVESEVQRLDQLKATKIKELFLNKQMELEKIRNKSHMEIPSNTEMDKIMNLVMSGGMDHADLLVTMEEHITKAREEACSRKDIMEKAEKWMASCNEERWLEEYNMDENRYSVSRGAHKNLKRAERARIMVSKIPVLVEMLMTKTRSWEEERNKAFLYDEVPLLAMLEKYALLRQEREGEKYRQRFFAVQERKRVQDQIGMQETSLRPRPSTSTQHPINRSLNYSSSKPSSSNRRLSDPATRLK